MVSLKELVNGQAYSSQAAFYVDGGEEGVSVDSLLDGQLLPESKPRRMGHNGNSDWGTVYLKPAYNKVVFITPDAWPLFPYPLYQVNIYFGDTVNSLWCLTNMWREALMTAWVREERKDLEYSAQLAFWLEQNAPTTKFGGKVCVYCGYVCNEDDLVKHMNIEHLFSTDKNNKKLKFTCYICSSVVNYGMKNKHMMAQHGTVGPSETTQDNKPKLIPCPSCNEDVVSLHHHWGQKHNGQILTCDKCKTNMKNPYQFLRHMKKGVHLTNMSGPCEICDNKVIRNLRKHRYTFHSLQNLTCIPCNQTFTTRDNYDKHRRKHNEKPTEKMQCPLCMNFYQYLAYHIKTYHRGQRRIRRTQPREMKDKSKTMDGTKINKKRSTFQCGMCEKEFKQVPQTFNLHLQTNHFQFLFDQLNIKYQMDTKDPREREEIGALIMQLKSVTTDSNHIQCTLCQKEMLTKDRMLTHMKSHLGFKRREVTDQHASEICNSCGKEVNPKFTRNTNPSCECKGSTEEQMMIKCPKCQTSILADDNSYHKVTCSMSLDEANIGTHAMAKGDNMTVPGEVKASQRPQRVRCPQCGVVVRDHERLQHLAMCAGGAL